MHEAIDAATGYSRVLTPLGQIESLLYAVGGNE